jgi:hypothetical protein
MPDGILMAGPPLLMDERTAARFCSMSLRDFRLAVQVGLMPAGRIPTDFARAGLLDAAHAARLATLGPLWHRAEIEARAATLWGLEGQARVGQAARAAAAQDALDAFQPRGKARAGRCNNS